MKIYLSHAGDYDYERELYEPLKKSRLLVGHEVFFPHDQQNGQVNTRELIKHCDLVLAEVSRPSTGQGIELGRADAAGVPVLCVYRKGAHISGSLQFVTKQFLEYTDTDDLLTRLAVRLNQR